jgi:hypothetical protein
MITTTAATMTIQLTALIPAASMVFPLPLP